MLNLRKGIQNSPTVPLSTKHTKNDNTCKTTHYGNTCTGTFPPSLPNILGMTSYSKQGKSPTEAFLHCEFFKTNFLHTCRFKDVKPSMYSSLQRISVNSVSLKIVSTIKTLKFLHAQSFHRGAAFDYCMYVMT